METTRTQVEAVAANVTRLLREAKISQRDAADATGIPITTLVRRLTGKTPFNVNELAAIAAVLDVPFEVVAKTDVAA